MSESGSSPPTEYLPSRKMPKALKRAFKEMGLKVGDYQLWLTHPTFVTKILHDFEQKFRLALGAVWMAMLDKALSGDVAAMKLCEQRFDADYRERKDVDLGLVDLPHKEAYLRVIEASYGRDLVLIARTAAELAQKESGHFDEEYLPGGALEHELDEADFDVVPEVVPEAVPVPAGVKEEEGGAEGDGVGLDFLT